jgi:hypothetical protein
MLFRVFSLIIYLQNVCVVINRFDDPLTSYRDKEPMTPAKIKEHEPRAVKREMT